MTFGGIAATNVVVLNDIALNCSTPPGMPGTTVDVALSNDNGSAILAGAFTYFVGPVVTSVSPSSGFAGGGTPVTLNGSGFLNGAAGTNTVTFGDPRPMGLWQG